jgi:hypothetical protein
LLGEWKGTGQFGGHFGLPEGVIHCNTSWTDAGGSLDYSSELVLDGATILRERGTWRVAAERPEALTDDQLFPVEVEVETEFIGAVGEKEAPETLGNIEVGPLCSPESAFSPSWKTSYLGVIGKGKLELLSDKIELLQPDVKLGDFEVNDLWRSQRMFGWVNNRILWAWDIALIGGEEPQSVAAGALLS